MMETPGCFYIFLGKENVVSLWPLESNKTLGLQRKKYGLSEQEKIDH